MRLLSLIAGLPWIAILLALMREENGYIAYAWLAFFALACARPVAGWAGLAAILPLFGNNPGGPHFLYFVDMALMALVVRWLAGFWSGRPRPFRFSPVSLLVFAFWLVSVLSLVPNWRYLRAEWLVDPEFARFVRRIYTSYGTQGIFKFRAALDLTLAILAGLAFRHQARGVGEYRGVFGALFASLAAVMALGIAEQCGWISLTFFRPENWDLARLNQGYRMMSIFWHAGWLAEYIVAVAPAALALTIFAWSRRKAPLAAFLGLAAVSVTLTYSRGGWLALAASFALLATLRGIDLTRDPRRLRRWAFLTGAAALAVAIAALGALVLLPEDNPLRARLSVLFAIEHRRALWTAAWLLFTLKPALGFGIGEFRTAHIQSIPRDHPLGQIDPAWIVTAHSTPLHLLAERGALGFGLFAALFVALAFLAWRVWRRLPPGDGRRAYAAGFLGVLAAMAVDGVAQYLFYIRILEVLFWLFAAMIADLAMQAFPGRAWRFWPRRAAARAALAAGAAALVLLYAQEWRDVFRTPEYSLPDGTYRTYEKRWRQPLTMEHPVLAADLLINHPDLDENPATLEFLFDGHMLDRRLATRAHHEEVVVYAPDLVGASGTVAIQTDRAYLHYNPWEPSFVFQPVGFAAKGQIASRPLAQGESIGQIRILSDGSRLLAARSALWPALPERRVRLSIELIAEARIPVGELRLYAPSARFGRVSEWALDGALALKSLREKDHGSRWFSALDSPGMELAGNRWTGAGASADAMMTPTTALDLSGIHDFEPDGAPLSDVVLFLRPGFVCEGTIVMDDPRGALGFVLKPRGLNASWFRSSGEPALRVRLESAGEE